MCVNSCWSETGFQSSWTEASGNRSPIDSDHCIFPDSTKRGIMVAVTDLVTEPMCQRSPSSTETPLPILRLPVDGSRDDLTVDHYDGPQANELLLLAEIRDSSRSQAPDGPSRREAFTPLDAPPVLAACRRNSPRLPATLDERSSSLLGSGCV